MPTRLPRSLHESPAYHPEWRYLRYQRQLGDQQGTYILPSSERDSLVRAYFKFRSGIVGPKHSALRYAQDRDDTNDRAFMGSRIKAMTVAGITTADIAKRLHTCAENIETYQKLFFDVADYVGDHAALGVILAPMLQQNSMTNPRERLWLLAALKLGIKGLDDVMDQRVKLSAAEQKEITEAIHTILAEQTLSYTLDLQSRTEVKAEVIEHYQKSLEARMREPETENDSGLSS